MMAFAWFMLTLVAVGSANECQMGEWGDWTEWTKLECGEEPSGAAAPTRGKYQPHTVNRKPVSAFQEGRVLCVSGLAGSWPCSNVDQMARFIEDDLCGGNGCGHRNFLQGRDAAGWTDSAGDDYAIFTSNFGTTFIRLPGDFVVTNPVVLAWMEGTNSDDARERDVLVVGDYAYITANSTGHGMQVVDLTALESITEGYPSVDITILTPVDTFAGFGKAQNLFAGQPGIIYAAGATGGAFDCNGGMSIVDISIPQSPNFAGCHSISGDINDGECVEYTGPDDRYTNQTICFVFNGEALVILNAEDGANPTVLSTTSYQGVEFAAQGTLDRLQREIVSGDELDEVLSIGIPGSQRMRSYFWNVANLTDPVRQWVHTSEYDAIDHNQYIQGDWLYQANHEAGFRVSQVEQTQNQLAELGYFDCFLDDLGDGVVEFAGAVGLYTGFIDGFNNGVFLANTIENGAFILRNDIISINQMIADGTQVSERYRYREIVAADDITVCPNTVDVDTRFVTRHC